ncbi:hypothetical protein [Halobaculum limi]|uniref:transcriptional regulator FilR1 domain-containing protein n=1 Tax=Halobaculum limi TaxID=3031916 RepID=UPI0024062DED|nr:hypothetical protein [Halobaculum sp. YSMS11]
MYRWLGEFEQLGFVQDERGAGFRLTRSGWLAHQAYEQVVDRLGVEKLAYLAGSESRPDLIRALARAPADKSTLAADPRLPSRATIHRTLRTFEKYGWIADSPGRQIRISKTAVVAVEQLGWLYTAVAEAIEKGPALNTMAYWAGPPLHTLVGSELLTKTPGVQNTMLNAMVEEAGLRTGALHQLQVVVPALDAVTFDHFASSFTSDHHQLILDRNAYRYLARPRNHHRLATLLESPTVDLRVHHDPLYTVLAIFNGERVLVGGSTRTSQSDAVVGSTKRLKRWATSTFDELWAESQPVEFRFDRWLTTTPHSSAE